MKFLIIPIVLLLVACGKPQPKIVYNDVDSVNALPPPPDTTSVTIANLPVHFDSTAYLIHPIGEYHLEEKGGKIIGSYSRGSGSISVGYRSGYELSGSMTNLKFQSLSGEELVPLTSQRLKIHSVNFLWSFFKKSRKQLLVYSITDQDTDRDGVLTESDVESLYISNIDGSGFRKISPSLQELQDWDVIEVMQRLYFQTIEDIDRNGEFDRKDKMHYFYINLRDSALKVVEYDPLK